MSQCSPGCLAYLSERRIYPEPRPEAADRFASHIPDPLPRAVCELSPLFAQPFQIELLCRRKVEHHHALSLTEFL
jgi:hypothetical protein